MCFFLIILFQSLDDATALDFVLKEDIVCWIETSKQVIRCSEINPAKKGKVKKVNKSKFFSDLIAESSLNVFFLSFQNTIVDTGLLRPEGLACDWINRMIYWTDSETKRIEVASLSLDPKTGERFRKVLVWVDLDMPRSIALAPKEG